MRLTPQQLPQHIAKGLGSLYVLYGTEDFLIAESATKLRNHYLSTGDAERFVFQCDGSATPWEQMAHCLKTPNLLSAKQYVQINLLKLQPSDPAKLLQCVADRLPDTLCVIQCSQQLKAVHRAKWLQTLESQGIIIAHFSHAPHQFQQWVAARAREANLPLSSDSIAQIANRTQGNYLACAQEIENLTLCQTAPGAPVATEMETLQNQYDPFALVEAILKQQRGQVIRILTSLKVTQGIALSLILWILAQMCRVFIQSQTLSTPEQKTRLLHQMGVRKSSHAMMLSMLHQANISACQRAFCELSEIDCQLKSGSLKGAWERTLTVCLDMVGGIVH